jgi:signal transduction histidine kinase
LRTPITTIKANIQLAMRRLKTLLSLEIPTNVAGKAEATYNMLERAESHVDVLNKLVGDMLDISRIQAGRLELHLRQEPCDLVGIVTEVVQEQRKAVSTRVVLTQALPATTVLIITDPDRIAQVLTNFLSNALKFSEADKPVEVSLSVEGEMARVAVRDYGQGLESEELQHIWECFYQAPHVSVLSGSGIGLGLGLYISQTLIERHKGQIGVESEPGTGSTFWFMLPLAQE